MRSTGSDIGGTEAQQTEIVMNWSFLGEVYAFFAVCNGIFAVATVLTACVFRLQIVGIELFVGPTLVSGTLANAPIRWRLLPLACSVQFLTSSNLIEHGPSRGPGRMLDQLAGWQQAAVALSGTFGLFCLSLSTLEWSVFAHHWVSAAEHVYCGAIQPFSKGQYLLQRFELRSEARPLEALGVLSTKLFFLNLIPYISSPSFQVIKLIWDSATGRRPGTISLHLLTGLLALTPVLIPVVGWTLALSWFVLAT
jgi:hypothetical protein